jgi:hypothetical protein
VPEMEETFPPFWQFLQELATFDCTCRTLTAKSANASNKKCNSLSAMQRIPVRTYTISSRTLPNTNPRRKTSTKNRLRKMGKGARGKSQARRGISGHTVSMENLSF